MGATGKCGTIWGAGRSSLPTNAGAFDVLPQITDSGQIYWQGWDGNDYEIYRYNTGTRVTTQLTKQQRAGCLRLRSTRAASSPGWSGW